MAAITVVGLAAATLFAPQIKAGATTAWTAWGTTAWPVLRPVAIAAKDGLVAFCCGRPRKTLRSPPSVFQTFGPSAAKDAPVTDNDGPSWKREGRSCPPLATRPQHLQSPELDAAEALLALAATGASAKAPEAGPEGPPAGPAGPHSAGHYTNAVCQKDDMEPDLTSSEATEQPSDGQ